MSALHNSWLHIGFHFGDATQEAEGRLGCHLAEVFFSPFNFCAIVAEGAWEVG